MSSQRNLKGKKFGKLTAIETTESNKRGIRIWKCLCECGNQTMVLSTSLRSGNTSSCGCIKTKQLIERNTSHGLYKDEDGKTRRLYNIWTRMKQRCGNINSSDFDAYGGRGIRVCEDWMSFENFFQWASSNGYSDNLSIDRINVNGNYEPSNCKWETDKNQSRNKRNNHFITHNGKTKTLAEWSEITGIESSLIRYRIKQGWKEDEIFNKPFKQL